MYYIHQYLENTDEEYKMKDAADLYKVFDMFCKMDDVQSFIYFSNFTMNKNQKFSDILNQVLNIIKKHEDGIKFFILNSKSFNKKYQSEVIPALHKGEKVFIITTYQTLGVGINLKYKLTNLNKKYYKKLSLLNNKEVEKDFDGIYLSNPSNVFPYFTYKNHNFKSFINVVYAIEYLSTVDSMKKEDAIKYIKRTFKIEYMNAKDKIIFNHDSCDDILLGKLRILIQAVGRICRTKYKGDKIFIFSSYKNAKVLFYTKDMQSQINLNKEFNEFSQSAGYLFDNTHTLFTDIKNANSINLKATNEIKSYLRKKWTEETIEIWKKLREYVLRFPTINHNEDDIVKKFYIEFNEPINEYSYDGYYWKRFGNDMCNF